MGVVETAQSKKATSFEIEILAEMHNLINISDEFRATKANIVILTKLIAVSRRFDAKTADGFSAKMLSITAPNLTMKQTTILNKFGWNLIDTRSNLTVPALPESLADATRLFLQLQHRKINTELSILTIEVMNFLMNYDLFRYDATREGDLYKFLMGITPDRGDYNGD